MEGSSLGTNKQKREANKKQSSGSRRPLGSCRDIYRLPDEGKGSAAI